MTRFAPSPTGRLHRGHAFSALSAIGAARAADGLFLLRIEDIDTSRCRPEFESDLIEDLRWLGVTSGGPIIRQSERMALYQCALTRLIEAGVAYRCFRTRREVAQAITSAPHAAAESFHGGPLTQAEEAKLLADNAPYAWRLSLPAAGSALQGFDDLHFIEDGAGPLGETGTISADPEPVGDIVLARRDVGVAYHLAVVCDDADQGVTHVIRGNDLFQSTHVQRLLQALLGLPTPVYRHHRLLTGPDGKRYAKRDRAETLADIRARGINPGDLRAELGFD